MYFFYKYSSIIKANRILGSITGGYDQQLFVSVSWTNRFNKHNQLANIHIHPIYNEIKGNKADPNDQTWKAYDIALIKLLSPPEISDNLRVNTICFPDNNSSVPLNQFVVTAGFGQNNSLQSDSYARIGPKHTVNNRLVEETTDPYLKQLYSRNTFAVKSIGNYTISPRYTNLGYKQTPR